MLFHGVLWHITTLREAKSPHGACEDTVERGVGPSAALREFRVAARRMDECNAVLYLHYFRIIFGLKRRISGIAVFGC